MYCYPSLVTNVHKNLSCGNRYSRQNGDSDSLPTRILLSTETLRERVNPIEDSIDAHNLPHSGTCGHLGQCTPHRKERLEHLTSCGGLQNPMTCRQTTVSTRGGASVVSGAPLSSKL